VETSALLSWGGAALVAVVALARWRPRRIGRVHRRPVALDLAQEETRREPPTTGLAGLPPEQLYTWLEWVQDDLRRIDARIDRLARERSQLAEQERLLCELLYATERERDSLHTTGANQ